MHTVEARRAAARRARAYVGVDAGKSDHVLIVRPADGRDSKALRFTVTRAGFEEACAYIQRHTPGMAPGEVLAGIEFAGIYGQTLAHYLAAKGYQVVSVMPTATNAWSPGLHGTQIKTDAKDAATIVDLVSHGRFTLPPFGRPQYLELRSLSSGIRRLVLQRSATVNRLRAVLQTVWPEYDAMFASFTDRADPTPDP